MSRRPIDRTSEDLIRELYERAASQPLTWRLTSDSLKRAANALLAEVQKDLTGDGLEPPVCQVYLLLAD